MQRILEIENGNFCGVKLANGEQSMMVDKGLRVALFVEIKRKSQPEWEPNFFGPAEIFFSDNRLFELTEYHVRMTYMQVKEGFLKTPIELDE